jgi:hypothetical protein
MAAKPDCCVTIHPALFRLQFQAVLEREQISNIILERGFSYHFSSFSSTPVFVSDILKLALLKGNIFS